MSYQLVCGIETHIELATKTKIFCGCTTQFGGEPNTHCCPVCTGQPGALPVLNKRVIEYAVRAGLAVHCDINNNSHMDRKNYVYPDLPKAYQISQFDEPVCVNGYVELDSGKKIRIERIHIEEDAGKLVHDGGYTYVDYNRGGVPLIEIVSMADISTPEEAKEYAEKLQLIMRNVGVSDCKMQEGSMRCDVNVSIHQPGEPWGTRTEIKNINSLSNIVRAIDLEMERQEDIIESGERWFSPQCAMMPPAIRYTCCEPRRTPTITAISLSLIFSDSTFPLKRWRRYALHFRNFRTQSSRDMLRIWVCLKTMQDLSISTEM